MAGSIENNKFAKSIFPAYPLDEAISWIQLNMEPEDVFSEKQLETWARDSGFTKEG